MPGWARSAWIRSNPLARLLSERTLVARVDLPAAAIAPRRPSFTRAIRCLPRAARRAPRLQIIDLGDRIVLRGTLVGRGRASGLRTRQMTGLIYHLSARGMVARQDLYWTWEETLAALNDYAEASRAAGLTV